MPKDNETNNPENPDSSKKKGKKGRKKGDKKKKTHKVYYPEVITNPKNGDEEEVISEAELSYKDKLLAVKMEKLAAEGLSNNQIIDKLGISRWTFYHRLKSDPYFSYCLYKHRGIAVEEVESALFNSATGFHYKEQQATAMGDVVTLTKYALPQVSAQKEFLYNRAPDRWKRKVEVTLKGGVDVSQMGVQIRRRGE